MRTNPVWVPMSLELIEEGRFLEGVRSDLLKMQRAMVAFQAEQQDRAKGAKGELTIKITLKCEDPAEGLFSIKGLTKLATPGRPASVSTAMQVHDDDGEPCLFVKRSGSDASPPRQRKICTDDGRAIDQETGQAAE